MHRAGEKLAARGAYRFADRVIRRWAWVIATSMTMTPRDDVGDKGPALGAATNGDHLPVARGTFCRLEIHYGLEGRVRAETNPPCPRDR